MVVLSGCGHSVHEDTPDKVHPLPNYMDINSEVVYCTTMHQFWTSCDKLDYDF